MECVGSTFAARSVRTFWSCVRINEGVDEGDVVKRVISRTRLGDIGEDAWDAIFIGDDGDDVDEGSKREDVGIYQVEKGARPF